MPTALSFDNSYISFTSAAPPFMRADDVGYAVSEFMWFNGKPYYAIGALAEASVTSARLSAGRPDEHDEDNLDLIFRMREADGGSFFEIILRSHNGTTYGGWAWGRDLAVLPECINGYRVISTTYSGGSLRFAYCRTLRQYKSEGITPVTKMTFSRQLADRRQIDLTSYLAEIVQSPSKTELR